MLFLFRPGMLCALLNDCLSASIGLGEEEFLFSIDWGADIGGFAACR